MNIVHMNRSMHLPIAATATQDIVQNIRVSISIVDVYCLLADLCVHL